MRLDPNPLFRKIIIPWYDSTPLCWGVLLAMVLVVLFGWAGIAVALSNEAYMAHIWVPAVMVALGGVAGVSVAYRLICRYLDRRPFYHS